MRSKKFLIFSNFCKIIFLIHSNRVRPKLPCLREALPLLDLDRDERKLDAFLQLHKSDLQVSDLRIFLPFTINLDPYLRKVLKEDQQAIDDEGIIIPMKPAAIHAPYNRNPQNFFQPQPPSQAFNRALPIYQQPPLPQHLPLMNFYNQQANMQHLTVENDFGAHQQHPKIPIDIVSFAFC